MNKFKKYGVAIIISVLIIVSILLILSNNIKGAEYIGPRNLEIYSFADIFRDGLPYTDELSWFASNNPQKFINSSVGEVFNVNKGWVSEGQTVHGLSVYPERKNEDKEVVGTHDYYYPSTVCMYHSQGNNKDKDGFVYSRIANVIDIESTGKAEIYKSLIDNDDYTAYEGGSINLTKADRKTISAFTYLLYQAGLKTTYQAGLTNEKNAIGHFWDQSIRGIFGASGKLDEIYYISDSAFKDVNAQVKNLITKAEEMAETIYMEEEPTVEISQGSNAGIEYAGGKAYIGPLRIQYGGANLSTIQINGNDVKWVTKKNDGTGYSNPGNAENLPSNQVIYLVINESYIETVDTINIKAKLDYTSYKARLVLITNEYGDDQELMNFAATKTDASKEAEIEILKDNEEEPADIKIIKVGLYGEKQPNVEFVLRRGNYNYVQLKNGDNILEKVSGEVVIKREDEPTSSGYEIQYVNEYENATKFTTNNSGEIIIRNLKKYEYCLIESNNGHYGYKGREIKGVDAVGAKITTLPDDAINLIRFKIENKGTSIASITLQNEQRLGDIEISKKGENGIELKNVEFTIREGSINYIQLIDNKGKAYIGSNDALEGTIIINKKNIAQEGQYQVKYVNSIKEATRFKTNAEGKIIVKNLEVYKNREAKSEYDILEIRNTNYGYKNRTISDVSIKGGTFKDISEDRRIISLVIGNNETTTVELKLENPKRLGNLEIIKEDKNNSKRLQNVEFILYQGTKFIRLIKSDNTKIKEISGEVIINRDNKATGTEYAIEYVNDAKDATKFKTDAQGKISIKNLEIYVEASTKYIYSLIETKNANYGYENISISAENVSITGGELQGIKSEREISFTIGDNSSATIQINLKNTKELGNIEIIKTDKDNNDAKLSNVEFVIWQGDGYIQLVDHEGTAKIGTENSVSGEITINKENIANGSEYAINRVSEYNKATIFKTDEQGKIIVKNLEIYLNASTKYIYSLIETKNANYGYENISISAENVSITGGELQGIKSEREISFTIGDNSSATIQINLKNTKELGDLVINKKGEDNVPLENVEFVIGKMRKEPYVDESGKTITGTRYIQLSDSGGNIKNSVSGTVIIDENNEPTSSEYSMEYVKGYADATRFKTGADGKIELKNLAAIPENYYYFLQEVENSNYGYEGVKLEDVTAAGGEAVKVEDGIIKFEINDQIEITVENPKELGNIELIKVGEYGESLEGVQFKIKRGTKGYIKLIDNNGNKVNEVKGTVTINENNVADSSTYKIDVEYVGYADATIFTTDSKGKITINNLPINKTNGQLQTYTAEELYNPNYGYGSKENIDRKEIFTELKIDETTIIKMANTSDLGHIELTKKDKDDQSKVLSDVGFVIQISSLSNTTSSKGYLQLRNSENEIVKNVTGTVRINKNNIATSDGKEYKVYYYPTNTSYLELSDAEKANITVFKTNEEGKIKVENLEVYNPSNRKKYSYKLEEVTNTNYGYSIYASDIEIKNIELEDEGTQEKEFKNEKALGGLSIVKVDEKYQKILLEDIEFVLSIDKDENTYIALYDQKGLVKELKGTAKINEYNQTNDGEYTIEYVKLDKPYLGYSKDERKDLGITVFKTDANGQILVNNLEVNSKERKEKYTYKLTETYNPYYGYEEIDGTKYFETDLEKGKIATMGVDVNMENTQEKIKISGYVWVENPTGKTNGYDCVYTGDSSEDIKLTNLYVKGTDGKLQINDEAETKVQIKLRDKDTGAFIKELPDEFDTTTGKYTFVDVEIENLANYEVVFVYDGFYYTTVVEQLTVDNGSKVKEVSTERKTLNDKFVTVKDNSQVVGNDGTVNTVVYNKEGNTSKISKMNFNTNVTATTYNAEYYLNTELDNLKKPDNTDPVEVIDNVNMGIVLREQPQISMRNDIHSVLIEFEGYQYNYKYNGRQNYYDNVNGDKIGVKFEQENAVNRYTRTVYASDIQAAKDQGKEIKVSVTYKMQIVNESRTLSVMPKQIINYFDARYNVQAVGLELNEETHTITNKLGYSEPQNVSGNAAYKSTVIDFEKEIGSINSRDNAQEIYITFDIQRDAILGLLNGKSTYHNAVEIYSYASYYGEDTNIVDGKQFMTEMTDTIKAGSVYAGIDKVSQPGNAELKLVDYKDASGNPDETKILDTSEFENDTSSAPSLILEATGERKLSGTIWEDSITYTGNNEKLGDGIYNSGEKPIKGVTVSLHKLNGDGTMGDVATYSDGTTLVTTTTVEDGSYTFGHYDEANEKYLGILPGKYVIKYTYNNSSEIIEKETINVNDYKSTIISSGTIKEAFDGPNYNEKWYLVEESNRYSDARDDISLRPEYDTNAEIVENITTTNNTAISGTLVINEMNAYTPKMDIGLEFTEGNEANVLETNFVKEVGNIDFGIVERPNVDIVIDKKITGLELIAQNGATIIPKGNPSNPGEKMQYVTPGLDGIVKAEIDQSLLQGAELRLEYEIKVTNNSDRDYLGKAYYYYGDKTGAQDATPKPSKVVDYLDITMPFDSAKNNDIWTKVENVENLKTDGFISAEVYNELVSGNYNILITEAFKEVGAKGNKTVQLNTSRYLAISDSIREENKVEIIEITGARPSKNSTPGNYIPTNEPSETDEDKVVLTILPPTGTTVNYNIYIIGLVATLAILLVGVVIIKKKIIK